MVITGVHTGRLPRALLCPRNDRGNGQLSAVPVILSGAYAESKNLHTEGLRWKNDNAKILRLGFASLRMTPVFGCFASRGRLQPHQLALRAATFSKGEGFGAVGGTGNPSPTEALSGEIVGEAFRLPRAADCRPYDGGTDPSTTHFVLRSG